MAKSKIKIPKRFLPMYGSGGKVEPIYTDNPKDKRLQAYNDSLSLYKLGIEGNKLLNNPSTTEDIWKKYVNQFYNTDGTINKNNKYNQAGTRLTKLNGKPVIPEKISNERNFGNGYTGDMQMYKKPVQPIIYKKKEEVKVPIPKKKFAFPDEQEGNEESYQAWRKTLPKNLQYEGDYDLKGFFKEFGKNSLPEGYEYHLIDKYKLPNHPSFSSDSQYYNPETEYLGGKWDNGILNWIYTPNTQFKNKIIEPKSMDEVRNDFLRENHNILSRNPNVFKKFGGEVLPMDSYIKNSNESTDVLIKLNDFKERVPEYIYKGYLMSGKDGIYKGVDKIK